MRPSNALVWLLMVACGAQDPVPETQPPAVPDPVVEQVKPPPPPPPPTIDAPWFPGLAKEEQLQRVDFAPVERPAYLLLIVDTLRADALGVYGQTEPTSPFLDQLARNGVVFVNHTSNSTWTRSSVASLLTGMYPNQHGVLELNRPLSKKRVTIAERFKEAGFSTATVLANPIVGKRYGLTQGYDFVAEPSTHFGGKHPSAKQVFGVAKKWLEKHKDESFFLSTLVFDPHHPYTPGKARKEAFCPECDPSPIVHPQREYRGALPTEKQVEDMKALYHAEVRETDQAIARFFGWLESSGLADRLTTIVVADHGEAFGEHKVFEHAFHMWDEVVRTPLILSGAAIRSRGFVDAPTQHVDVVPTLGRLAGWPEIPESAGLPLVQHSTESGLLHDRPTVSEVEMYGIHRLSVRHGSLKLVRHEPLNETRFLKYYDRLDVYPSVARKTGRWELYDLKKDPLETTNLAGDDIETHPLAAALKQYRENTFPDQLGLPDDGPSDQLVEDLKALGYLE
jgi:arylsulfatase